MRQSELPEYNISGAKSWFSCTICGEMNVRWDKDLRKAKNPTCSVECRSELQSLNYNGDQNPNWRGGKKILSCDWCGDELRKDPAAVLEHNFCSQTCWGRFASENRIGEDNPAYSSIEVECDRCGESVTRRPSTVRDIVFCSIDCRIESDTERFSGDSNPNYRRASQRVRYTVRTLGGDYWPHVADRVRKNAEEKCELCDTPSSELSRSLDVHHIVPLISGGLNFEENLMVLCRSCHKRVETHTNDLFTPHLTKYATDD